MKTFDIHPVDRSMQAAIQEKIDNLNKPKGSLGRLEELAMQVCLIQQTLSPSLAHPCHLLFGGDHGIEREGVSVSPREVTWQQMLNFVRGGGGVNMFCRQHGFKLYVIDVGVDYDLTTPLSNRRGAGGEASFLDRKIARGTKNFLYEPAMTEEEFDHALSVGISSVDACAAEGCRILSIGEMGIGNTSPSSIWMHLLGGIPLAECIGAGAGLDSPGIRHKYDVLSRAVTRWNAVVGNASERYVSAATTFGDVAHYATTFGGVAHYAATPGGVAHYTAYCLRYFGGFEMVAAIGAMLRAAERHIIILIDGFIMTACAVAAIKLYPAAQDYMIFTHCGDESGHKKMLGIVDAKPLLSLGLRLGEGTGALCAFPIVDSAVRMINEMNNFDNAKITKYF